MIEDLQKICRLIDRESTFKNFVQYKLLAEVGTTKKYPIYSFTLGSQSPTAPVLFLTGGVHGLERIGAQLAWSFLKTTIDSLLWDESLKLILEKVRIVYIPLLNPTGYYGHTRSNFNGVDLMRNAPIDAIDKIPFLAGGHRYSNKIPWFRGFENQIEKELEVLIETFEQEAFQSPCIVSLDFHSGFGMKDRLWFPFSYSKTPFDDLPELNALVNLFEQSHPYHIYQIEPQSHGYLISGDVWDHLFLKLKEKNQRSIFIPLTLEMGSWSWVRKNPLQIFSLHGPFNPIKEHRQKRTYRRHHLLYDFLIKALYSHQVWSQMDAMSRSKHEQMANSKWY